MHPEPIYLYKMYLKKNPKGGLMLMGPRNEQGQSAIEYLIITFMIGIVCLGAFQKLGKTMKEKIQKTEESISGTIDFRGKI